MAGAQLHQDVCAAGALREHAGPCAQAASASRAWDGDLATSGDAGLPSQPAPSAGSRADERGRAWRGEEGGGVREGVGPRLLLPSPWLIGPTPSGSKLKWIVFRAGDDVGAGLRSAPTTRRRTRR